MTTEQQKYFELLKNNQRNALAKAMKYSKNKRFKKASAYWMGFYNGVTHSLAQLGFVKNAL